MFCAGLILFSSVNRHKSNMPYSLQNQKRPVGLVPSLGLYMSEPILDAWNKTTIFLHMLFANPTDRNHPASAGLDSMTKHSLALINALSMMPQSTMSKISPHFFTRIKPIMNGLIVLWDSTKLSGTTDSVMIWVCHCMTCGVLTGYYFNFRIYSISNRNPSPSHEMQILPFLI